MRGHKPPGHPPALNPGASDRRLPAGDGSGPTHQGKGRGGPGGLRVGRPCCPSCKRRKTQDARDSRRNKNTKHHPPPAREPWGKHRENAARGPNPPRRKKSQQRRGKGKNTARGTPPTQKKKESATRRRNTEKKTKTLGKPRLVKGGDLEAEPKHGENVLTASLWGQCPLVSRQKTHKTYIAIKRTFLSLLSSCSCRREQRHGDDAPPTQAGTRK